MELKSACVVITGAAMGIGLATAKRLIDEGSIITLWDINPDALKRAEDLLESEGGKVFTNVLDITDKKAVYEAAEQARQKMGRVDILINNAGYVSGGTLLEGTDEVWERTINVNLTSMIYTIRAFLPEMYARNSGHIVNISSAAATIGVPGMAVYTATKWAVWGLTESMRMEAYETGKTGVRWSSVHPSYIRHGLFEGARLRGLGNLIVPLISDHDVVARAIVSGALKKGRFSPKRPRTVNMTLRFRALMPDSWFQRFLILFGVPGSMSNWKGRR
ncbi:MAG: SDR family NAD(P)-dependent oxidoreductase [Syntrophaceae bacterium]|nr:SDR family NAD(P)-dependent oxidoreductase [Syntrophaceae bacterium]